MGDGGSTGHCEAVLQGRKLRSKLKLSDLLRTRPLSSGRREIVFFHIPPPPPSLERPVTPPPSLERLVKPAVCDKPRSYGSRFMVDFRPAVSWDTFPPGCSVWAHVSFVTIPFPMPGVCPVLQATALRSISEFCHLHPGFCASDDM